jgi:hypothetical protein
VGLDSDDGAGAGGVDHRSAQAEERLAMGTPWSKAGSVRSAGWEVFPRSRTVVITPRLICAKTCRKTLIVCPAWSED